MESILVSERLPNKGDVLIVFSARDTEKGKFTFYSLTSELNINIIYVNDYSNQWYLNGTPDFNNEDHFLDFLQNEIKNLRCPANGNIYTLGSSMGAYAALKFGSLLGALKILALGPESELMLPHGRSITSVKIEQPVFPVRDISSLSFISPKNVLILSGNNDIVDFYCACSFKENNPDLMVYLINNWSHVVAKYMNSLVGLKNILNDFFIINNVDFLKKLSLSGTIKLSDSIVVRDFYYSLSAGLIDISKKDILIKVAEEFPKWSLVQFYAAKIYWQLGDMGKCELYLNKALKTQASLGRARLLLCQLLFDSDRYSDAEYHILILLEKNITFGISIVAISIFIKKGNLEKAIAIIAQARELNLTPKQRKLLEEKEGEIYTLSLLISIKGINKLITDKNHYSYFFHDCHFIKNNSEKNISPSDITLPTMKIIDTQGKDRNYTLIISKKSKGIINLNITGDNFILYVGAGCYFDNISISAYGKNNRVIIGRDVKIMHNTLINLGENVSTDNNLHVIIPDRCNISNNSVISILSEHQENNEFLQLEPGQKINQFSKILSP
ncbi:Uncharacterised protein [Yersinia intermedia]|uniref:tetratricopeptide repeat protein n=3 Tax=Yersinia intermedia TaxID=631 RepID=UPI0005E366B9|nr:hypothetical protein [Yersinia intermedia]UZM72138.1 hypothetical protein OP861_05640 [Yersinia intermedia]CNC50476.1 Uncharacterised protein [Yersinia intermedia]CNG92206.1 Uncharacterised protein [Yersinia intermedia]